MRFGEWNANLKTTNTRIYNFLYYGLIFVTVGLFLASIGFRIEQTYISYTLMPGVSMLFPAMLLALETSIGGDLNLEHQLYSITIIVFSAIAVRAWAIHRYF